MTLPSKEKWLKLSGYERRRLNMQMSWREKGKVIQWRLDDDFNEPIAEHKYAIRCDLAEEQRQRLKKRKEERREIQNVLIEVIARRTHSPKEMARISRYTRTYIVALSRNTFSPEDHRKFLLMDEGITPKGPCIPLQIDRRTEEEKWLDEWEARVEKREAAVRESLVKTEIDKRKLTS
jgi:hypothetical protein